MYINNRTPAKWKNIIFDVSYENRTGGGFSWNSSFVPHDSEDYEAVNAIIRVGQEEHADALPDVLPD